MLHHGVDAIGIHVLVFVFYCLVEHSSERLGLQTAAKQHVAPVVADAVLPAFAVGTLFDITFLAHEHAVIVPVQHIEGVGIRRAVQVHVAALRVGVAGQQLERHPVCEIFRIEIFAEDAAHRHRIIVELVEHGDEFGMVAVAFDLQLLLEFRQIVFGIVGESDYVRVALEFEVVDLVQLAVLVEAVRLERAFVELLHLRVQAIVVEGVGTGGFVLDVQVHELRAQSHHLVDAADQVVCHLVAESQPFAHMLVQCDGALPAPFAFAAFQLDFVVLLLIETGRLAAHLHGGVRRFSP